MPQMPALFAIQLPDFMTPEGQVLAWSIFVFVVLLGLLWKFALGPIMHALEEREHGIQHTIDDAEKRMKEAEARVAEYDRKIMGAKDEVAALIAQGKRDVDTLTADEKTKAKLEIEAEKERAKREIALAKDAAVAELRDRVVTLTGDIAAKVIRREINHDDHRAFISSAMNDISAGKN